jgi:hypothetical protein
MKRSSSDWVAIILAGGLSTAVVTLVIGVIWAAIQHGNTASSLSENESAVLTTAFGAMAGILGAWIGYRAGNGHDHPDEEEWPEPLPSPHTALPNWPDRHDTAEIPPKPPPG